MIKFNLILFNGKFSKELKGETNKMIPLGSDSKNLYLPEQLNYKISMTKMISS